MQPESITSAIARYVIATDNRAIPDDVIDEARKCLVDWMGVCMAATGTPEARIMRGVLEQWRSQGLASLLGGGTAAAPIAAMYNGTLSHCLDYDDTHIPSIVHISGPAWAAVLAVGAECGCDERRMLRSFVTGFEVTARLGGDAGIGLRLNQSGWHATPILGRFGAVCALCAMLGLDETQVAHALALGATQAGGMTASFGTMAKPMHAGKAAMDAVTAVQLAEAGFTGATDLLDAQGAFLPTLFQDRAARFDLAAFDDVWEIRRNSYKPYAACQLAHAAIDAAQRVRPRVGDRTISTIGAFVHPLATKIAAIRDARTTTEGKFSMGFCVALGLAGFPVVTEDFSDRNLRDPRLQDVASRVQMHATEGIDRTATRLEITLDDGEVLVEDVADAFGSIGNPMDWAALDSKFLTSAKPLGESAQELLGVLHAFEQPGSLARAFRLAQHFRDSMPSAKAAVAPDCGIAGPKEEFHVGSVER